MLDFEHRYSGVCPSAVIPAYALPPSFRRMLFRRHSGVCPSAVIPAYALPPSFRRMPESSKQTFLINKESVTYWIPAFTGMTAGE